MAADEHYHRALLVTLQTASLCDRLTNPQLEMMDHNVYVRGSNREGFPVILWSPVQNQECQEAFDSLEDFRKHYHEFSAHSLSFPDYRGYLFKGAELFDFRLLQAFPGSETGGRLPEEIMKLLGISQDYHPYTGAFPPIP